MKRTTIFDYSATILLPIFDLFFLSTTKSLRPAAALVSGRHFGSLLLLPPGRGNQRRHIHPHQQQQQQQQQRQTPSLVMTTTSLGGSTNGPTNEESARASDATTNGGRVSSVTIYPYETNITELLLRNNIDNESSPNVKVLHFIRHAQGHHNVDNDYRNPAYLDARLTTLGMQQCQQLSQRIRTAAAAADTVQNTNNRCCPLQDLVEQTDLIVTSPLTRCIQTALLSLKPVLERNPHPPHHEPNPEQSTQTRQRAAVNVVAHESIRETVNFNCDRRRSIAEISADFPTVDFSPVPTDGDAIWQSSNDRLGDDAVWTEHRESAQLHRVAARGRTFFAWLQQRPERHVVVCSHAAFLRCLLHYGHAPTVPKQPPQMKHDNDDDDEARKNTTPVVAYRGFAADALEAFQADFANCEIRSVVVQFPH